MGDGLVSSPSTADIFISHFPSIAPLEVDLQMLNNRDALTFNKFNHFLLYKVIPRSQLYCYYFLPHLPVSLKSEAPAGRAVWHTQGSVSPGEEAGAARTGPEGRASVSSTRVSKPCTSLLGWHPELPKGPWFVTIGPLENTSKGCHSSQSQVDEHIQKTYMCVCVCVNIYIHICVNICGYI